MSWAYEVGWLFYRFTPIAIVVFLGVELVLGFFLDRTRSVWFPTPRQASRWILSSAIAVAMVSVPVVIGVSARAAKHHCVTEGNKDRPGHGCDWFDRTDEAGESPPVAD